jgi:hypothetical protein
MRLEIPPHQIQNVAQDWITKAVENLIALFPVHHNLFGAQHGEVLGSVGLLNAQAFHELPGGHWPVAQQFHDCDSGGVGEGLENFGFELTQSV